MPPPILSTLDTAKRVSKVGSVDVTAAETVLCYLQTGNQGREFALVIATVSGAGALAHVYLDVQAVQGGTWARVARDTDFNTPGDNWLASNSDGTTPNVHTTASGKSFSITININRVGAGRARLVAVSASTSTVAIEAGG